MIDAARDDIVRGRVVFTGSVEWKQIHKLYSMADVFVTASLSENHPMTLIEASVSGLPIIARRGDGVADFIEEGYNGYMVDSDRHVTERESELLGDECRRLEFSRNGRNFSDRFNPETHVEKLESLYQQVRKQPPTQER